jgi:hypothetical protein
MLLLRLSAQRDMGHLSSFRWCTDVVPCNLGFLRAAALLLVVWYVARVLSGRLTCWKSAKTAA